MLNSPFSLRLIRRIYLHETPPNPYWQSAMIILSWANCFLHFIGLFTDATVDKHLYREFLSFSIGLSSLLGPLPKTTCWTSIIIQKQVCSNKDASEGRDKNRIAERRLPNFIFVADILQIFCRYIADCLQVICRLLAI